MAIARDNAVAGTASTSSPHSYSKTNTGSDLILYVHVYMTATSNVVTAISYNSVAMTLVDTQIGTGTGNWGTVALYRLVNPASGANNVSITFSSGFLASVATSYTGARQSGGTFVSAKNAAYANTLNTSLTPNSANNWIVAAMGNQGSNPFTGGGTGNATVWQAGNDIAIQAYDSNGTVGTGSITMTTGDSANPGIGVVAESFEPTVAAGPTTVSTWDGVTQSTGIKEYFGVALASVKTVDGLS